MDCLFGCWKRLELFVKNVVQNIIVRKNKVFRRTFISVYWVAVFNQIFTLLQPVNSALYCIHLRCLRSKWVRCNINWIRRVRLFNLVDWDVLQEPALSCKHYFFILLNSILSFLASALLYWLCLVWTSKLTSIDENLVYEIQLFTCITFLFEVLQNLISVTF